MLDRGAEVGSRRAQAILAVLFYKGEWVEINETLAFKYAQASANNGDPFAMFFMGLFYETGAGTKINLNKAIYWYRKCAAIDYEIVQEECINATNAPKWRYM